MGLQTDVDINVEPAYKGGLGILRMGAAGFSETSVNIYPLTMRFSQKRFCLLKLWSMLPEV
jgi:hypothetical protein